MLATNRPVGPLPAGDSTVMPNKEEALAARKAGLRYTTDQGPGIHRKSSGRTPVYVNGHGRRVKDRRTLARIRSLVIPPAWKDVWISPHPNSHLQATGRDARGRKQHRYHPQWRTQRDANKYDHMIAFAKVLPKIRRQVRRDLRKQGLPREKVLAAVVQLLEKTLIRVGNDEYAKQNNSFGLTTMRNRHAALRGATIRFQFRGKSGVNQNLTLNSPTLAKIIRHCQDLPGQELFQYVDEQERVRDVGSSDVNDYLRQVSGLEITAKDFRTWAGTSLAAQALLECEKCDDQKLSKRNVVRAIEQVASRMGNTPRVCRNCYVHPAVIDAYLDQSLATYWRGSKSKRGNGGISLSAHEKAVLALLRHGSKRKK